MHDPGDRGGGGRGGGQGRPAGPHDGWANGGGGQHVTPCVCSCHLTGVHLQTPGAGLEKCGQVHRRGPPQYYSKFKED